MGVKLHGFTYCHRIATTLIWISLGIPTPSWCIFLEPSNSYTTIRALQEERAILPCKFQPDTSNNDVIQQVTWFKQVVDKEGKTSREQVILAHLTFGQTEFGSYTGRVEFADKTPTSDSSLVIKASQLSNAGTYVCHVTVFPSGTFEVNMELVVWISPISSLDSASPPLVEGQGFNVAATCKSWGYPPPIITWETELPGSDKSSSSKEGKVSSKYSLHPLRAMNGKKLDCVISHASFKEPKRLEYKLVVHYPPDVTIKGYDDNWFVGLERATLKCIAGGNPIPQNFTWSRRDSALPEGIAFEDNSLVFQRPLELSDMGVYVCLARNRVGKVTAEQSITITETEQRSTPFSNVMIIILAAVAAAVLVLMVFTVLMVNRYHKRKHKNMKTVLREKTQEIDTLSRQASFRRLNSVSTDPRLQTEENIPLRVEGTIRNSMSSLGDRSSKRSGWLGDTQIPEDTCVLPSPLPSQTETAVDHPARSRDSRSTASLGRGATDFLGRPHLMNSSRRSDRSRGDQGEDREKELEENTLNTRLRVESFVRNSNLSLESRFHPPLYPSKIATDRGDLVKPINGTLMSRGRGSPDQGLPSDDISDEGDVQTSSSLISESLSNHFHVANGTLKPKPSCNGIFIHPREQMV